MIRQSKVPWSVVAIIIAAALIIAVIGFLPKGPRKVTPSSGARIPPQPTASPVEFTGVQIEPATVGDAVTLNAVLHNAGNSAITGVEVGAQFWALMDNRQVPRWGKYRLFMAALWQKI